MTKRYNPKEKVFYYIFEKKGIFTSYRDLAEILNFPVATLHRVVKELEEEGKIKTTADENYTHFELVGSTEKTTIFDFAISSDPVTFTSRQHRIIDYLKEEGKIKTTADENYTHFELIGVTEKTTIFDFAISSDPVTFTTRQHRLIDFLKSKFDKYPSEFIPKMEVLFALRIYYFTEESRDVINLQYRFDNKLDIKSRGCTANLQYFLEDLGSKRYDMKEYSDLTKDIQFINEHCDVRQVLIINRAGSKGGIKIAKKSEGADYVRREFIHILKKLKRNHTKRKFLEKDGNFRLVFQEEKEILEILK